jgi:hypothetical protein
MLEVKIKEALITKITNNSEVPIRLSHCTKELQHPLQRQIINRAKDETATPSSSTKKPEDQKKPSSDSPTQTKKKNHA